MLKYQGCPWSPLSVVLVVGGDGLHFFLREEDRGGATAGHATPRLGHEVRETHVAGGSSVVPYLSKLDEWVIIGSQQVEEKCVYIYIEREREKE